jgi:ABC-type polysaccharide/polyol phosphate transport system ATPase subunit
LDSAIDRAVRTSGCGFTSPTELLIDEWGTMGEFRPTVQDMLCETTRSPSSLLLFSHKKHFVIDICPNRRFFEMVDLVKDGDKKAFCIQYFDLKSQFLHPNFRQNFV